MNDQTLFIGGSSNYLVHVGHNGLMDFKLENTPQIADDISVSRTVAVVVCMSQAYFSSLLRKAGAKPELFATHFLTPGAYSVHTLIDGWLKKESPEIVHKRVTKIYSQYQKLKSPALKLFSSKFSDD